MVSIEEALKRIKEQDVALIPEELPLTQSLNSFLSEPIIAPFDLPSFDNSAMDGYAVCGEGETFQIVGEVAAGNTQENRLESGQAMRIFTGGRVPENTTAVIMQEQVTVDKDGLKLGEKVIVGKNIRRKGAEIAGGQPVFEVGHRITPATIGMLSALGMDNVSVFQQPVIHIVATGNELVEAGQQKEVGQIYESNTHALAAALQSKGFYAGRRRIIEDNLGAITDGISEELNQCDVLLMTGGISVGAYDYAKQALEENGVEELFYKVMQKPGKPLYFGRRDDQFVFALPGNPASSLTCFYVYVLPLLERLSGGEGEGLLKIQLPLKAGYDFKSDRPTFLKAFIENGEVSILEGQGSSMIRSMAMGNALVFIDKPIELEKGELVTTIPF